MLTDHLWYPTEKIFVNGHWQKPDSGNQELLAYLEQLKAGQQKLSGVVEILSNNQTASNSHLIGHMEVRLSEVQKQILDVQQNVWT